MSDLVELLRANANEPWMTIGGRPFALEAAAEITRLRAENERLEARRRELWEQRCDADERITELEGERDTATRALDALREMYAEEVTRLEGMKARGDLTAEWGECSLICARETFRNIAALSKTEGKE